MKAIVAVLVAALLTGCAGLSDVIERRQQLYAPKPLSVGSAVSAYQSASAAAKAGYQSALGGLSANPIAAMVDSGIAAANHQCRQWLTAVNLASQKWEHGQGNLSVLHALLTGILGAVGAHSDLVTAYGLGSAAFVGYNRQFEHAVLAMADADIQAKLLEVMAARATQLRAEASTMSYPMALDAIEGYSALCSPSAAKAAVRSSLAVTAVTATPAGTIVAAVAPAPKIEAVPIAQTPVARIPVAADAGQTPVSPAAVLGIAAPPRDDTPERISAYLTDQSRVERVRQWMAVRGINVTVPAFVNGRGYESARRMLIADFGIGAGR